MMHLPRDARPAILVKLDAPDGLPTTMIRSAEVKCPRCTGWTGVECPHGCGVRLVDITDRVNRDLMERLRVEQDERRRWRTERREARRAADPD